MSDDAKQSPKVKDLAPKAQTDKEAEEVKGGFSPVDGLKLGFSPVDSKLPPRP